jgi:TonB family protein
MDELMSATQPTATNQSDLLLWIAGGAIAAVGIAWLVIMKPWGGSDAAVPIPAPTLTSSAAATPTDTATGADEPASGTAETTLDNPLRMAQLAYDAGMLVEPEEYSAWTLYARVVKTEPKNAAALAGLAKVADDLVRRGETALDQGRFDDARSTVERIRTALPEHPGAKALAARIWPQVAPQEPGPEALRSPVDTPRVARVEVPAPTPARQGVDALAKASEAFNGAMAAGRLLTPTGDSAKHYVGVLMEADRDHELTQRARETLSQELLSRAAQSVEALDAEAAKIWIDEAEALGVNTDGVTKARTALNEHLIAMESAKPVPASSLKIVTYVAPVYPPRALDRGLEGWVDIEFTVGSDGATREVTIADASHESYFRREAKETVEKWRFEPRVFMGQAIEQRSYTRIRFVL